MTVKAIQVSASVHKDVPACCRASLLRFVAVDIYRGGGEWGDRISCACGNTLIYGRFGWRLAGEGP